MIRIRGFARKGRSTKGGSLPASPREISARNGASDHVHQAGISMGNNGHSNGNEAVNGNGTTDLTPGVRARNSDDRSRTLSRNGDELTNYLHGVVEEFVDSTTPVEGRPPL